LFRHDVAFCLGQRQDPAAIEVLTSLLRDHTQHGMYVASKCRVFSRETWARPNACTHQCPHHPMNTVQTQCHHLRCRVRHEAGEALGAIGTEACLVPLKEHQSDEVLEVAETCQMALQRIQVGYSGSGCHHLAQVHVSKVQWRQVCLGKEQLTCLVSMPMPAVTSVPARAPRCHQ
jgi:hypothetical protein